MITVIVQEANTHLSPYLEAVEKVVVCRHNRAIAELRANDRGGTRGIRRAARAHILDPANDAFLSAVSVWEISRKYTDGGLELPTHPSTLIPGIREKSGIASLPITEADSLAAEKLERFHKDPFNHMLIAQALMGGLAIVTSYRAFSPYPVRVVW
jgi:PIN domain nuclease of toxin-antitoxin system